MRKFNLEEINVELFNSEIEDLDAYIDVPENQKEILEKCDIYSLIDYPIKLFKTSDNNNSYWLAEHPDLPGCKAHGNTKEEAIINLEDIKNGWIYAKLCDNEEIPKPDSETEQYSGRILLRLPKVLHCKLAEKAITNNTSINQEILFLISYALGKNRDPKWDLLISQIEDIKEMITGNSVYCEKTFNQALNTFSRKIIREFDKYYPEDMVYNIGGPKENLKRQIFKNKLLEEDLFTDTELEIH